MIKIFTDKFIIPESAIDVNGHVNNVAYVQWMQDIANAHSSALGFPRAKYDELGVAMVAKWHHIEYLQPAFAGEEIEAHTWAAKFKKISATRKYKFVRTSDKAVLVKAETLWVYVDQKTGKPRAFHQEFRDAFVEVPEAEEP